MKKKTVVLVVVLMGISLLGLVGLQAYWINLAFQVKEEQFNRTVQEALAQVVDKLETQEAVWMVSRKIGQLEMTEFPQIRPFSPAVHSPTVLGPKASSNKHRQEGGEEPEKSPSAKGRLKEIDSPSVKIFIKKTESALPQRLPADPGVEALPAASDLLDADPTIPGPHQVKRHQRENDRVFYFSRTVGMDSASLYRLLSLRHGYDSLGVREALINEVYREISLDSALSKHGARDSVVLLALRRPQPRPPDSFEMDARAKGFRDQRIEIRNERSRRTSKITRQPKSTPAEAPAVRSLLAEPLLAGEGGKAEASRRKIAAKTEKISNVVGKMAVEYIRRNEPIQKRLDHEELDTLLRQELQAKSIRLPYAYGVVNAQTGSLLPVHSPGFRPEFLDSRYRINLFPNDLIPNPDFLLLHFPGKTEFVFRSMAVMLVFSGIFTGVILLTFATTTYIILRQKKLSEMKNDFINNMTHEFKTPIATISLAIDSITNPKVSRNQDRVLYYSGIIRDENRRMNAHVEQVLQMARLERNEIKLHLLEVEVHELIAEVADIIGLQVGQRQGTIDLDLKANPSVVRADPQHLYNVLCNLLDNANKYSPAAPHITVSTRSTLTGVLIAVEDRGRGMAREVQQKVFDTFYRAPFGNLHDVKGFGLGLSYVKAIVEAHKGKVRVKSEPDKGSRFEVYLPQQ